MKHDLKAGIYKHYKGKYYLVLGLGCHSETRELLVIYVALYTHDKGTAIVARPVDQFFATVEHNGKTMPRFTYCGPMVPAESAI